MSKGNIDNIQLNHSAAFYKLKGSRKKLKNLRNVLRNAALHEADNPDYYVYKCRENVTLENKILQYSLCVFKYAGKMNYYLSALDEYVRMPDENPSIGIILCRSMSEKKVEFAFRDMTKPMGVVTYRSTQELPEQYQQILPSAEELKKLL